MMMMLCSQTKSQHPCGGDGGGDDCAAAAC